MGLLNKIRNEHGEQSPKTPPRQVATTLDESRRGEPIEPADPCPTCRCPSFWRSAYGGELRCAECDPWPSLAMVGERWTIYTMRNGQAVWMPCLRRGERAREVEPPDTTTDKTGDEIRVGEIDDESGHWLVIERVRK